MASPCIIKSTFGDKARTTMWEQHNRLLLFWPYCITWCNYLQGLGYTVYVLIQAHALIDAHAPAAQNTSHQIHTKYLIKHQISSKNTKIQAVFWSVWLLHMLKSALPCQQRFTQFLFTVYMCIVGTGWQALLLKLIDVHPSPCTCALRFY